MYFEVLLGSLRYFEALLGTLRYFYVRVGSLRYFDVILCTSRYIGFSRYYFELLVVLTLNSHCGKIFI